MVGLFPGTFDFLHPGHLKALEFAKTKCDWLIALLEVDPSLDREDKSSPIFMVSERYEMLKACKYVDEIMPYNGEEELISILRLYTPCVRFVGADWMGRPYTGNDLQNIKTVVVPRFHLLGSTAIRERMRCTL
jgi:glycerol-3-phosphate cytidylyltransferase